MADLNRQWLLKKRPVGLVKESTSSGAEAPMPQVGDAACWSRPAGSPSTRRCAAGWRIGPSYLPPVADRRADARGQRRSRSIESSQSRVTSSARGLSCEGMFGWQEYAARGGGGPDGAGREDPGRRGAAPDPLGVLGITGLTAYFGLLDLGQPKEGRDGGRLRRRRRRPARWRPRSRKHQADAA